MTDCHAGTVTSPHVLEKLREVRTAIERANASASTDYRTDPPEPEEFHGKLTNNETILTRELDAIVERVFQEGMRYAGHTATAIPAEAKESLGAYRKDLQQAIMNAVLRAHPQRLLTSSTDEQIWWTVALDEYRINLRAAVTGNMYGAIPPYDRPL